MSWLYKEIWTTGYDDNGQCAHFIVNSTEKAQEFDVVWISDYDWTWATEEVPHLVDYHYFPWIRVFL